MYTMLKHTHYAPFIRRERVFSFSTITLVGLGKPEAISE